MHTEFKFTAIIFIIVVNNTNNSQIHKLLVMSRDNFEHCKPLWIQLSML